MDTSSANHSPLLSDWGRSHDEGADSEQQQQQLPATMRMIGLVPGFLLIIFVAFLTNKSVDFLLKYTNVARAATYGAVMGDSFGRAGRIAAQVSIIINSFGTLVVYLIILADVLSGSTSASVHHKGVLEEWAGSQMWWNSRSVVVVITAVFILAPLVCFRRIDSLRFASALSVALAVFFVIATAVVAIWNMANEEIGWPRLFPNFHDGTFTAFNCFSVVPVVVTAFLCHHCAHPILHELEETSNRHAIVQAALVLCTTIYLATSLFAYLLFGDNTLTDVLSNFDTNLGVPHSRVISDIVRVGYAVHLMLVFPLLHFSLRLNLDGLLFPQAGPLNNNTWRFYLITVCTMALCLLGACLIPNIWDVFQITGSTSAILLCYIFPAGLVLRDAHGISTRRGRWIAWFMIVLAVASSLIALSGDISHMVGAG